MLSYLNSFMIPNLKVSPVSQSVSRAVRHDFISFPAIYEKGLWHERQETKNWEQSTLSVRRPFQNTSFLYNVFTCLRSNIKNRLQAVW